MFIIRISFTKNQYQMKTLFLQTISNLKLVLILIVLFLFLFACNKLAPPPIESPPPIDNSIQPKSAISGISDGGTVHGSVTVAIKTEEGESVVLRAQISK